jgi:hypothetical protein
MTRSNAADDRREVIERYFASVPSASDRVRARLCAGLVIAGLWLLGVPVLVCGAVVVWRGWGMDEVYLDAYRSATPKPRDSIIDKIRVHELRKVERRALDRLDLTADELELESAAWNPLDGHALDGPDENRLERKPLIVTGPVPTSRATIGRDGVWRFSQYAVMAICPTDYHLGIYRCVIDLRVAGLHQEETHEYHYMDVVAVSTAIRSGSSVTAQSAEPGDNDYAFAHVVLQEFQLVVSSGDRSTIVVGISDERDPAQRAHLLASGMDRVIGAVRGMLRDKKTKEIL